jgi:DNA-binding transcriptional LysR family regulator
MIYDPIDQPRRWLRLELADLATLRAVARAGTMTGAAGELSTVQSNVTARVRLLEQELGVRLFDRHSRGVSLTPAGHQLLGYAERILLLAEEAGRAVRDDGHPRGPLRIGSLETTASLRLPPVLTAYMARYPDVDLVLRTGTTAELVAEVAERRLDAALVVGPVDHPALRGDTVVVEELVVVTHPAVRDVDAFVAGAPEVKAVLFRRGCSYRERLERYLAPRARGPVRVIELGTLDGIVGCVGAGLGLTALPRAVAAPHADRGVVRLHALPPPLARAETVLVRRRDAYVPSALARLVDCFREVLAAAA